VVRWKGLTPTQEQGGEKGQWHDWPIARTSTNFESRELCLP
jgi:hypothetical protein